MADDQYALKTPITDAQWRRRMELLAGMIKQTMTLDTACILMVTALASGFFDQPRRHWILGLSLLFFIVSIFGCYMVLWVATMHLDETYEDDNSAKILFKWGFLIGYVCFIMGLGGLALFVWTNLIVW